MAPAPAPAPSPATGPSVPSATPIDALTRWTASIALSSALALVLLGLAWELNWAPTGHRTLAIKVLPLLLALPGLARRRMYTYRWVSLAVWLYIAEALVRVRGAEPLLQGLALAELALGLVLFTAVSTHVRWRLAMARRHEAAAASGSPSAGI